MVTGLIEEQIRRNCCWKSQLSHELWPVRGHQHNIIFWTQHNHINIVCGNEIPYVVVTLTYMPNACILSSYEKTQYARIIRQQDQILWCSSKQKRAVFAKVKSCVKIEWWIKFSLIINASRAMKEYLRQWIISSQVQIICGFVWVKLAHSSLGDGTGIFVTHHSIITRSEASTYRPISNTKYTQDT